MFYLQGSLLSAATVIIAPMMFSALWFHRMRKNHTAAIVIPFLIPIKKQPSWKRFQLGIYILIHFKDSKQPPMNTNDVWNKSC